VGAGTSGRANQADTEVTVARQPSGKDAPSDEVEEEVEEVEDLEEEDLEELDDEEEEEGRSAQADALWSDVRIQPVEIALPKGVGYTLRAYRLTTELTPTEVEQDEDDDFAILTRPGDQVPDADEDEEFFDERPFANEPETTTTRRRRRDEDEDEEDDDLDSDAELDDDDEESDEVEEPDDSDEEDELEEEEEEEEEPEPEEVPVFLGHRGKVFIFRSEEGLVDFVKSDAEHDFTQLDSWESLKSRIFASTVVPNDEDRYELDLVVENLRGGQDAWDADLIIAAGEIARDLAYALRMQAVSTALSPGSPLDDLDEALRASAGGGVGGFFARRRLKKIGAQQAALGWRTIIGKISAAVDWRD
jgi:hypothetical protein